MLVERIAYHHLLFLIIRINSNYEAITKACILYPKDHKGNSESSQCIDNQPMFFVCFSVKLCVLCGKKTFWTAS